MDRDAQYRKSSFRSTRIADRVLVCTLLSRERPDTIASRLLPPGHTRRETRFVNARKHFALCCSSRDEHRLRCETDRGAEAPIRPVWLEDLHQVVRLLHRPASRQRPAVQPACTSAGRESTHAPAAACCSWAETSPLSVHRARVHGASCHYSPHLPQTEERRTQCEPLVELRSCTMSNLARQSGTWM